MKTLTVGEFETHVADALDAVKHGETVEITAGENGQPVAVLAPPPVCPPVSSRKLGLYEGKAKVTIHDDWEMTDEEFLNS